MSNHSRFMPWGAALVMAVCAAGQPGLAPAEDAKADAKAAAKGDTMSYQEARDFLAKHTKVVELVSPSGGRVAVCPEWQGRVMTSTCGGLDGPSFGFINREFIEAGKTDPHFNNYGAEERMWLSPEGGQFSLWFKPGVKQTLADWFTPPAFNDGAWEYDEPKSVFARFVGCATMHTTMEFQNASGTPFKLGVNREVRLLDTDSLEKMFGSAAKVMQQPEVKMVAYRTVNRITNNGPATTKEKGLVSIWILGMMNCGSETVIIVPYRAGDEADLGPVVKSDYFGPVPAERLKVTPQAVLFRADGNYRAKIGTSQRRARHVLGSIDFRAGVLTLVHFDMPADPAKSLYMNNMWGGPHAEPYRGDVANAYNDGPPAPGKKGLGPFYEIESLSPALPLAPGESLVHRHSTIHIQADLPTLTKLARDVLGVDLEAVRSQMLAK